MAQFARPSATPSPGMFGVDGAATHHEALDETSASDSEFIHDNAQDGTPAILSLSSVTDPVSATGHTVRWRCRIQDWVNDAINLAIVLRQGGTTIATARSGAITNGAYASASYTLSAGEANSITNYAGLNFLITPSGGPGDDGATVMISWAEFEVPDVAAAGRKINPLAGPFNGLIS